MAKIEQPVWEFCDEQKIWCPFANINYMMPLKYFSLQEDNQEKQQQQQDKEKQENQQFYQTKQKFELSKGTKVYSKEYGYGIIQDFGKESKICQIKCDGEIYEQHFSNLMIDFPLIIRIINFSSHYDDVIRVSPFATASDLLQRIQTLLKQNENTQQSSQQISVFDKAYYNGKALEKSHQTLQELNISPLSKILVIASQGIVQTLTRFTQVYDGWGYSKNQLEAITFQVSKKIWLVGFGIYGPDKGTYTSDGRPSPLNIVAQVHQGIQIQGMDSLQEKSITIETMLDNKIYEMKFSKPVVIMPETQYSISLYVDEGYSYYGNDGKQIYTTDDDIEFKFDYNDQSQGSDYGCGQFPEIYYFTK